MNRSPSLWPGWLLFRKLQDPPLFTSTVQGTQAQASASVFRMDYRDLNSCSHAYAAHVLPAEACALSGDFCLTGHMSNVFKPSLCLETLTLGHPIPDSTTLIIQAIFIFSDEESETSPAH